MTTKAPYTRISIDEFAAIHEAAQAIHSQENGAGGLVIYTLRDATGAELFIAMNYAGAEETGYLVRLS